MFLGSGVLVHAGICLWGHIWKFVISSTQFKNDDKLHRTPHCKVYIADSFPPDAFTDLCQILVSIANLWLLLTSKCSFDMNPKLVG